MENGNRYLDSHFPLIFTIMQICKLRLIGGIKPNMDRITPYLSLGDFNGLRGSSFFNEIIKEQVE